MKKILLFSLLFPLLSFAEWSNPVKVEELSSPGEDYYICMSLDGQWMYLTSIRGGYGDDDIYVSHWETDHWGTPENLGPVINDDQRNLSPSISPDGDTLYFVSYGQPGGIGSYDIWKSWKIPGGWAEPINLGPNVNTPGAEWTVYIAPDNNHLYIASNAWGGIGFMNVYVCTRTDSGWSLPESLENINYIYFTYGITMTADMQTMYYSEARWVATELDIFESIWEDGQWSEGVWLDPPINTEVSDHCPTISADGNTMYFASRRDTLTSDNDIYVTYWTEGIEQRYRLELANLFSIIPSPNPFNPSTTLTYTLPAAGNISLKVYDLSGREIASLYDGFHPAGTYKAVFDGTNLPSGVYFARLTAADFSQTQKMLLLK